MSVFGTIISSPDLKPNHSHWPVYPSVSWILATRYLHHPCTTVALSEIPVLRNLRSAPRQSLALLSVVAPHSLVSAATCLAAPISGPLGKAIRTAGPCCCDKKAIIRTNGEDAWSLVSRTLQEYYKVYSPLSEKRPHRNFSIPHHHRYVTFISINKARFDAISGRPYFTMCVESSKQLISAQNHGTILLMVVWSLAFLLVRTLPLGPCIGSHINADHRYRHKNNRPV